MESMNPGIEEDMDQPNHPVDFSVVICAYTEERWADLVVAVRSVQNQTVPAREIIVVIDHNPDLFNRVQTDLPEVIALENQEKRGLSGARNTGIAAARGTVIAFMDEDARAEPDWLEHLSAGYANPQVIGVGGSIEPLWMGGQPGWFPQEFHWVVGCTYRGLPVETAPIRNLIGANMSFRKGVFTTAGGFSNGIGRIGKRPVGCEETELCIRAACQSPGSIFLYEPRARVNHRVPTERSGWQYFAARCFYEGISKAQVSRLVGSANGLASERTYTFRVLPRAVMAGIQDGLFHANPAGFARAAAVSLGLMLTSAGYVWGTVSGQKANVRSVLSRMPR